jgi:hypothetical protein
MFAVIIFAIDVNLARAKTPKSRNTNPKQPVATANYCASLNVVVTERLAPHFVPQCTFCTARLENYAAKCTRSPAKAEGRAPVKILLTGITNFYA